MIRTAFLSIGSSILVLCASCGGQALMIDSHQATTNEEVSEIVGGDEFDGLPAVGNLVYEGEQQCTGTLIAPRTVLTAAHCVYGFEASRMRFAIGPAMWDQEASVPAAYLKAHPHYSPSTLVHDIGLVYLAEDAPVEPMSLLTHMDASWIGASLFFVGYGVDNGYSQTGKGRKRAVWIEISGIDETTFRYEDPERNTCDGDSGGPAFYKDDEGNYFLAGVTSYGDVFCSEYGVNTRVDTHMDFVNTDFSDIDNPDIDMSDEDSDDPCHGESLEGPCDSDTVGWCENNELRTRDCAASGQTCGFSHSYDLYWCI